MALILETLVEILRRPNAGNVALELATFAVPLWIAALVGLLLGWAWRPKWAADLVGAEAAADEDPSESLAGRWSSSGEKAAEKAAPLLSLPVAAGEKLSVTEEDLHHLCRLVEVTDGGPVWQKMMEKSLPTFNYQAWRRDPENGPPQYRSSSIFEDATPEVVRDFFWDDEFRIKNGWDVMLLQHSTIKECQRTGTITVQWVRKFPFFCSDREYVIGRRIWSSGSTYYCITKGVPNSVPRKDKLRRVDLYYSSWCIRPAESKRDGQMTACEVLLFHHEDMGIPWEIAKYGVRQGMWGCVKKIEPGLRAYQASRASNEPLSRYALMAQIDTKFDAEKFATLDSSSGASSDIVEAEKQKHWASKIPKVLVVGGAVALACTLDHGLLTKAVIFGVARRFANIGKRL